jgi:hypothetical protein
MKTIRKALLATAVASALSPAAVMADTTLFGSLDIAVAVESAAESALAVTDSPAGDNIIGVEGSLDLENGNAVTYQYIVDVDLDGDGNSGFGETYHAFIGYKWDSVELRAGVQDLPERLVLDKADNFAGTYADQQTLVGTGTTADSSVMLLGGNDTIKYAVSLDTSNNEDSNDEDANDGIRFGGMADFAAGDNSSFAVGFETLTDSYDLLAVSANLGVSDNAEVTLGFEQRSVDATDQDISTILVGGNYAMSDTTTLKAQFGTQDLDVSGADDRVYIAVGADFELSDNVTTYVLAASGTDNGLTSTGEVDADGDASVLAGGIKLSF